MSTEGDRRAEGVARVPFEALVEVGGELGPSFEAQAIDISEEGMHLRTAYLPEVGQPLTFRFDAGPGRQVVACGEVTWREELGKGGEFGVRFTNLDGESVAALGRILGLAGEPGAQSPGSRVRLHIDGLASPMRARVKTASVAEITAFSELGFLQVGKQLELEDAQTGAKRPASIGRVEVEVDPESRVPQLVVTLSYEDAAAKRASMPAQEECEVEIDPPAEEKPAPQASKSTASIPAESQPARAEAQDAESDNQDDDAAVPMDAASKVRVALAQGAAKMRPVFANAVQRAKVTLALLAAKRHAASSNPALTPVRRTTAPPPDGALHATGRKVVRSEPELSSPSAAPPVKKRITKRGAAVAGAVAAAGLLAVFALRSPAPPPPLASAPPAEALPASHPTAEVPEVPAPIPAPTVAPLDPTTLSAAARDDSERSAPRHTVRVAPFGNGPVSHANVLHLKMDGPIEKIEGAQQPNGFTVVIPSRRSLEPAGPLAARDGRIASIRVSNDPNGAELALSFKDGVPNYQVRAKGDTLEILLAPLGALAESKAPSRGVQAKHGDADGKLHSKAHKHGSGPTR